MVQKPETKTDRRVQYTKRFLKDALLELMREKPVDKITPTELCRRADVNRNTFYTHYYTPRDVLMELEEEFADQILTSLGARLTTADTDILLQEICKSIRERKDFCAILLSDNGDAAFLEKIVALGRGAIIADWEGKGVKLSDMQMDMVFDFVVHGSIAILRKWAADDMIIPPSEIAELIGRITVSGLAGLAV